MLEGLAAAGRDVPALRNRPNIIGLQWLWEAFQALTTCREIGMAAGPIPWVATQRYAEVMELTPTETMMLHAVIQHMDAVWLKHQQDQREQSKKSKTKLPARRGR